MMLKLVSNIMHGCVSGYSILEGSLHRIILIRDAWLSTSYQWLYLSLQPNYLYGNWSAWNLASEKYYNNTIALKFVYRR